MKTKLIALYLPQFHQIKENDLWWGKGFTEWTSVRNAREFRKTQRQPRIPFNNNYYDLSLKENIKWQADLAKEYGIDGFCIYHYYSLGRKLLEKPAELLLENTDIDIEYFFSWANHDWRRVWASSSNEMLRKQEYGEEEEIYNHFYYLLDFFQDNRYIKINNKPVFSIYQNIEKIKFEKIVSIWEKEAIKNGFEGIYWIGTLSSCTSNFEVEMNNYFRFEPNYTKTVMSKPLQVVHKFKYKVFNFINNLSFFSFPLSYDYKGIVKQIYKTSINENKAMLGFFTGWDNTPRHKEKGYFYNGETVDLFEEFLRKNYSLSNQKEHPFLIINAWNEWGEGAYLEPDQDNEFKYLESIKRIKEEVGGNYEEKSKKI